MSNTTNHIILFVKYPEKGCVKTRLTKQLDDDTVISIYKAMVKDCINMLEKSGYKYSIFYDGTDSIELARGWLGLEKNLVRQSGNNLGEKMSNAFKYIFENYHSDSALLIGSDTPDIPVKFYNEAFTYLSKTSKNSVVGPTIDGGYYLIGFNRNSFSNVFFQDINWSSNSVFKETISKLQETKVSYLSLQIMRDIDYLDDLKDFYLRNFSSDLITVNLIRILKLFS